MITTTQQSPITANSVFLLLSIGCLRVTRKLNISAVDTNDIAPELLRLSKTILQSNELKAIGVFDREVRTWIKARALPSPFQKGIIILPVRLVEAIMQKIDSARVEREQLISAFLAAYDRCKTEAQEKLGSAFDERDYPDQEAVKNSFFFDATVFEMSTPGKLKAISKELYQMELTRMQNLWTEASAAVTGVLLQELRKMTAHIKDRLTPSADGKQKIFRDSVVDNFTTWLELFKSRNITGDAELVDIVDRAKELISGIDAKELRDNKGLRAQLATDFSGLTDRLDQAIISAPIRSIDLEDEAV